MRDGSGTVGGGANGTTFLDGIVFADNNADELTGGGGEDYFRGTTLEVTDAITGEITDT